MNGHEKQQGKTKILERYQDCDPKSNPRGMGEIPHLSHEHGDNKVRVSGTYSKRRSTSIFTPTSDNFGGIVSQLTEEAQEQLAYHQEQIQYHQQQSEILETKIKELNDVNYQLNLKE